MRNRVALCYALLLLLPICSRALALDAPGPAPAKPLGSAAGNDQLFESLQSTPLSQVWEPVGKLVRLANADGGAIAARLEELLSTSTDSKVRLACARALCQLNRAEKTGAVLADLIARADNPEIRRGAASAVTLASSLHSNAAVLSALAETMKTEKDEATRIVLARSHARISKSSEGRDVLHDLFQKSTDSGIRDEAALVLAENGGMAMPDIRTRMLELYTEPTERGERAYHLLKGADAVPLRVPPTADPAFAKGIQLLAELTSTIRGAYADDTKVNYEKLFQNAAKGMVRGLDPFSQYLDPIERKNLEESLHQDYAGIGAYVALRDNAFIITSPIFKSPAYEAGLRALDVILEIDGQKVSGLLDKGGLNAAIEKLKGKAGSEVKLKYRRRGFGKPLEITVVRKDIRAESVFATMLPGDIAYIRLTKFGERSTQEMKAAMEEYVKKQNAKGLIFDLRDNGGGLLRAGVEIADLFLSGKKLVVYSEGRKEFSPRRDFFASGSDDDEKLPMVTLVNGGTASASEIVSGALQDHKRSPLIGEKTFGKGSVQQILNVRATDNETRLRLTIAKYYLPTGRSIHEKGIEPEIVAKPREPNGWILETVAELRRKNVFEDFVRNSWDANRDLYLKLAQFDGRDPSVWPGFDEFYKGLNTTAPKDDVRAELRYVARHLAQDYRKSEFAADIEEDRVLQRGVFELLKKLGADPAGIAEYKKMAEQFKETAEKKDEE